MMKKQLIMENALELFAKQGIEATSVQQITELCGISKGAFYLSFKSKDELVLALIDHFMIQMTSVIDCVVKETVNIDELLYKFYFSTFQTFYNHTDFAKVLIKEQMHTFNEELILKLHYYDSVTEKIILSMVERLYGDEVKFEKYDLIYCIKGFMKMYSELFLFYSVPLDLDLLARSLVEKTNVIAKHTTVPFISEELLLMLKKPVIEDVSKEQIADILDNKIQEIDDSFEKESLVLLKQQLIELTLDRVIIKGLLENIRNHPQCKWIYYLLRNHYQF